MTIRYQCDKCDSVLKIKDDLAGTKGKCPKCKKRFVVPAADLGKTRAQVKEKATVGAASGLSADEQAFELLNKIDTPLEVTEIVEIHSNSGENAHYFQELDAAQKAEADEKKQTRIERQRVKREKKTAAAAGKANTISTAAQALQRTAEEKRKRAGMPDEPDDDESEIVEMLKFYGRQYAPWILGLVVVVGGLYYSMSSSLDGRRLPELVYVHGVVKMDGKPVQDAIVRFAIQKTAEDKKREKEQKLRLGGSTGITNKDGEYVLSYVRGVEGAVPGKHVVTIESGGMTFIPLRYADGSIQVEVSSDKTEHNFKTLTSD